MPLFAITTACGGGEDPSAEQIEDYAAQFGIDVEVEGTGDDQQIVVNPGLPGAQAGQNLDLPDDFPADVPPYPGWSIYSTTSVGPGLAVGALVPDDLETVAAFYQDQLPGEGWTPQEGSEVPTMRILRFSKENRVLGVTITAGAGDGQSTIQVTVASVAGN